jgi:O-antigen ligase
MLVGIGGLVVWAAGRVLNTVRAVPGHPLRWVLLCYSLTAATAFAAGLMRPLNPIELSGSSRSIFPLFAYVGLALLACDALTDRRRMDELLFRVVLIGGAAASIGIAEFAMHGFDYQSIMRLPGLTSNVDIINDTRSNFQRVDGAASHPIEYAVALAALVPLALHYLSHAPTRGRRQAAGLAALLLLTVLPMTVSRSAIVAVFVGVAFYFVEWSPRTRLNAAVLAVIGIGLFRAAVPGLLGTLRSLLLIGTEDPSIKGRTQDYAQVPGLLHGHEIFGRGLGTFQPLQYFYLDNQYLGSLLEGGAVALASLIMLFVVSTSLARGARKRSANAATRSLGQSIAGALAALAVSGATFDELSFKQTGFLVFLLAGCAGALWSMTRGAHGEGAPSMRERSAASGTV